MGEGDGRRPSARAPAVDAKPAVSPRAPRPRKRITLRVEGPTLSLPSDPERAPGPLGEDEEPFELRLPAGRGRGVEGPTAPEASSPDEGREASLDVWGSSGVEPPPAPTRRSSDSSDTIRLVSVHSRPPPPGPPDLAREMHDRLALGDFTGALRAAELVLGQDPDDREANEVAVSARARLEHFYLARLGGLRAIFGVNVEGADVRWLGLDHRAGFLFSRIDGTTTIDELVDLSGMPRHEALKMLQELLASGAIRRVG